MAFLLCLKAKTAAVHCTSQLPWHCIGQGNTSLHPAARGRNRNALPCRLVSPPCSQINFPFHRTISTDPSGQCTSLPTLTSRLPRKRVSASANAKWKYLSLRLISPPCQSDMFLSTTHQLTDSSVHFASRVRNLYAIPCKLIHPPSQPIKPIFVAQQVEFEILTLLFAAFMRQFFKHPQSRSFKRLSPHDTGVHLGTSRACWPHFLDKDQFPSN